MHPHASEDGWVYPVVWGEPAFAVMCEREALEWVQATGQWLGRNLHLAHEWMRAIVASHPVREFLGEILGPEVYVENAFMIVKPAGAAFMVPPHQDGINGEIELDPWNAVSIWFALSSVTETNGGLRLYPGSHLGGYRPWIRAEADTDSMFRGRPSALERIDDLAEPLAVTLLQGEACAFSVCLAHSSPSNHDQRPRAAINVRYVNHRGIRKGPAIEELFRVQ